MGLALMCCWCLPHPWYYTWGCILFYDNNTLSIAFYLQKKKKNEWQAGRYAQLLWSGPRPILPWKNLWIWWNQASGSSRGLIKHSPTRVGRSHIWDWFHHSRSTSCEVRGRLGKGQVPIRKKRRRIWAPTMARLTPPVLCSFEGWSRVRYPCRRTLIMVWVTLPMLLYESVTLLILSRRLSRSTRGRYSFEELFQQHHLLGYNHFSPLSEMGLDINESVTPKL